MCLDNPQKIPSQKKTLFFVFFCKVEYWLLYIKPSLYSKNNKLKVRSLQKRWKRGGGEALMAIGNLARCVWVCQPARCAFCCVWYSVCSVCSLLCLGCLSSALSAVFGVLCIPCILCCVWVRLPNAYSVFCCVRVGQLCCGQLCAGGQVGIGEQWGSQLGVGRRAAQGGGRGLNAIKTS